MAVDTSQKEIKVALDGDDSAPTWRTLPGPSGSINFDGETADDTIFGASFASQQTGLVNWSVSSSAFYKGVAPYEAKIYKSGTATSFTDEATSLVSGKTYQIDDTTKRVVDWNTTVVIKDDGVAVASTNYTLDYMHGKVTFVAAYSVNGAVTFASGKYLPMSAYGWASEANLTQTVNAVDQTSFSVAQGNSGYYAYGYGLKTVTLSMSGFYAAANEVFTLLSGRTTYVIELNADGNAKSIGRGIFICTSATQSGDVGGNETESAEFSLWVPSDVDLPFSWHHETDTTLNAAIQDILTAFEDAADIWVQYLPDGTDGFQGKTVLTDCSLSVGISDMATFTANFQGNGTLTELTSSS